MAGLLVLVLLLPLVGALSAAAGPRLTRSVARAGVAAAGLSALGSAALLVRVVVAGPVSVQWTLSDHAILGLTADRVTVVLLLLVLGVSAVVQGFALRYLAGDPRASWFVAGSGVLTAASAGLMTASTLIGLAVCWSLAGLGLLCLLGTYPHLPAARDGVRRTAVTFVLGDAALWTAVGIATARWGSLDLHQLDVRVLAGAPSGLLPVLGCLVVLAALSRSAQVPFQGWLPSTLTAPTPVSALLHAGVINAGGVLLIRLAPLAGGSRLAMALAFTAGAVTTVYGTALMLTKPDVKGALAHSTMGQMGFMIMTCGLGLYAAALLHLVTHGLYKASLFLASGSAIQAHVGEAAAPPRPALSRSTARALPAIALAGPAAVLAGIIAVLHPRLTGQAGAGALLVFAWATASAAALGWLRRRPTPLGLLGALLALVTVLTGYVAAVDAADRWLAPAMPVASAHLPGTAGLLLATVAVLGVLTVLRGTVRSGWLGLMQRRVYVLALNAGHVRTSRRPRPVRGRPRQLVPVWAERVQVSS